MRAHAASWKPTRPGILQVIRNSAEKHSGFSAIKRSAFSSFCRFSHRVYNAQILSTQPSQASDPLLLARQDYRDALKAGDIDKIVSLVDSDVVMMPPND